MRKKGFSRNFEIFSHLYTIIYKNINYNENYKF